jgi:hypothetical protein
MVGSAATIVDAKVTMGTNRLPTAGAEVAGKIGRAITERARGGLFKQTLVYAFHQPGEGINAPHQFL